MQTKMGLETSEQGHWIVRLGAVIMWTAYNLASFQGFLLQLNSSDEVTYTHINFVLFPIHACTLTHHNTHTHTGIRILQGVLLKVCLILGVKLHAGVKFTGLVEPKNANSHWSVSVTPTSSPVSSHNFDIILAADGKQNSLPGFRSKEFRARLALAITVNFVNSNTQAESSVPEISGVAYIYSQQFFKSLAEAHGIELENIVYYKDETHYFVMTATKRSLLRKGVLRRVRQIRSPVVVLSGLVS